GIALSNVCLSCYQSSDPTRPRTADRAIVTQGRPRMVEKHLSRVARDPLSYHPCRRRLNGAPHVQQQLRRGELCRSHGYIAFSFDRTTAPGALSSATWILASRGSLEHDRLVGESKSGLRY